MMAIQVFVRRLRPAVVGHAHHAPLSGQAYLKLEQDEETVSLHFPDLEALRRYRDEVVDATANALREAGEEA